MYKLAPEKENKVTLKRGGVEEGGECKGRVGRGLRLVLRHSTYAQ